MFDDFIGVSKLGYSDSRCFDYFANPLYIKYIWLAKI